MPRREHLENELNLERDFLERKKEARRRRLGSDMRTKLHALELYL